MPRGVKEKWRRGKVGMEGDRKKGIVFFERRGVGLVEVEGLKGGETA